MGKILFSRENYDTILGIQRPNGTSQSWYLKETGEVQLLHTLGAWNVFSEKGEQLDIRSIEDSSFPPEVSEIAEFASPEDIGDSLHIYLIKVNNQGHI